MASNQNIAIILLAAGASSRMTKTKQLLPWDDTTLLGHAIRTAERSLAKSVVVVLGAHAETIRKQILDDPDKTAGHHPNGFKTPVDFVENTDWSAGLGSSIACGIRCIQSKTTVYQGALIMLADQPLVDTEYVNEMIGSFSQTLKGITATAYPNRAGVPALFAREYFEKLRDFDDDHGAQGIINDPDQDILILHPKNKTLDIDTKSDYEAARSKYF